MSILEDFFSVAGKVVLVTGGSRGIGEAIAQSFVEAKARVYICSRNEKTCSETAARIAGTGYCVAIAADLATEDGRRRLVQELGRREDRLDVLINNAGAIWAQPLAEYTQSGWDKVYDLNVKGVFFIVQSLLPLLEKAATAAEPARIINIGSIGGFHVPQHETYAYSSSKAALHHLSKHLAKLLAPSHILVNVIAPGMFPSRMMKEALEQRGEEAVLARVPLKRFVNETDMAGAAMFLASKASSFVTGTILPVDGGTATTL
jgi:NAD(P)-dependent dehydrogenase (short-subunit alcohol dehydrogenase family)